MKYIHLIAGFIALALGAIGAILPLLPTVPFLILAAFFFSRSSPDFEEYLLNHPHFGEPIRTWRARRAIGRRAKKAATIAFAISLGSAFVLTDMPWPLVSAVAIGLVAIWIWTRPDA